MRVIVCISALLAAAAYLCTPVADMDLWWHIVVGRWIIAHHALPVVDHWTMFGEGQQWRAYSWLPELLFALCDRYGGVTGLLYLQAASGFLLALSLTGALYSISRDGRFAALFGLFTFVAQVQHFTLRPQLFVWALFALVLALSDAVRRDQVARGFNDERALPRWRYLLMTTALFALWSNTHLSASLGIVALLGWSIDPKRMLTAAGWRTTAALCVAALVGTLCTPYFGGEWLTMLQTSSHPMTFSSVVEFRPATIGQYATVFVLALVALNLIFFHLRPAFYSLPRVAVALLFLIAGLAFVKFLPFATITLAALLAEAWRESRGEGAAFGGVGEGISQLLALIDRIPREGLAFLLLAYTFMRIYGLAQAPLNYELTPVAAVNFIDAHSLSGPYLNTFGSGGYLMYRWSDESGEPLRKVSIDGRTNLISAQQWVNFENALNGREGWQKYIEEVRPQTIVWPRESPLTSLLQESDAWCQVFESGSRSRGFSVFVPREVFEAKRTELKSKECV